MKIYYKKIIFFLIVFCLWSFVSGRGTPAYSQQNEYKDLFLAKQAFEDGFYDVAERQLNKFLRYYPYSKRSFDVQLLLAQSYLKQGQVYKASNIFEELLKGGAAQEKGRLDEVNFWLGETYFKGKDYEGALVFYEKMINEFPDTKWLSYAYYNKAWCLYELKRFEDSKRQFEDFIRKYPGHEYVFEAEYKIGEILFESQKFEQAKKYLLIYVKKHPAQHSVPRPYCLLGEIHYRIGDYSQAIKFYEESLKYGLRSQYTPYARYGIGWSYYKLGAYKESLDAFAKFMEFFPKHNLAQLVILQMGQCGLELKDYEGALGYYNELISRFPKGDLLHRAYLSKAKTVFELGRIDESIIVYKELLERFTQADIISEAHYNLGIAYLENKDLNNAVDEFKLAEKLSPEAVMKVNALTKIADIHLEKGEFDLAQKLYDKILIDFSDSKDADYAQYQLGVSFLGQGRFDAAILAFANILNNFPKSRIIGKTQYHLGIAYFKKGNFSVAESKLKSFIEQYPKSEFNDQALFHMAASMYNLKNCKEAIILYTRLIRSVTDRELLWRSTYQRAWCYYHLGKEKEAINGFVACLSQFSDIPISADIQFWLGQYYLEKNDFGKAQGYFLAVLNNPLPNELKDDAMFQLGVCYRKSGRLSLAVKQFNNFKRGFPESEFIPEVMLRISHMFITQKKKDKAQAELKELINKFASTAYESIAYKKLADIEESENNIQQAISYLNSALNNTQVLAEFKAQLQYDVARLWEASGDDEQATEEYLKVGYLYPDNKEQAGNSYWKVSMIFENNKEYEKAVSIYEKIIAQGLKEKEKAKERLECLKEKLSATP